MQNLLIEVVANAAKGPVVVVFMNGGAVDASDVVKNSKVHAILGVGYPGQAGGQGLADVLFGAYNPAGRLTQTWYHANYVDMVRHTSSQQKHTDKPYIPRFPCLT